MTHRGISTAVALITGHTPPLTHRSQRGGDRSTGPPSRPSRDARLLHGYPPAPPHSGLPDRRRAPRRTRPLQWWNRARCPRSGGDSDIGHHRATRRGGGSQASLDHHRRCRRRSLAEQLAWRIPGPLSGRTVAVTRARAQASGLARRLGELGAEVIQAPSIRIQPLPGAPLDPHDLLVTTWCA